MVITFIYFTKTNDHIDLARADGHIDLFARTGDQIDFARTD